MTNSSILHIEDDDAAAFLVQAALDQAAIPNRTYRVSSGEDALAYLCKTGPYKEAQSPGLVLLDLNLPRVDGWTVLSTMKERHDLRRIPVVVLSSSRHTADRDRALDLGAAQYVVKENTISAMRKAILKECGPLMSFRLVLEAARSYTIRMATVAFERSLNNGVEMNVAIVLPEGAQVKLLAMDAAESVAQLQYGARSVWMSLHDLRDHAVLSTGATHQDFPTAPFPSQVS